MTLQCQKWKYFNEKYEVLYDKLAMTEITTPLTKMTMS